MIDATGRYEFELAQAAYERDIPVCIVKPLRVRRYAGAIEQLAKTDKIDAALIAEFAFKVQPKVTPQKSKKSVAIKNLMDRKATRIKKCPSSSNALLQYLGSDQPILFIAQSY